jgi:hypothetical protein
VNLIWIKREDSFAQNAAARSVEAIGQCIAGDLRRRLLYQG